MASVGFTDLTVLFRRVETSKRLYFLQDYDTAEKYFTTALLKINQVKDQNGVSTGLYSIYLSVPYYFWYSFNTFSSKFDIQKLLDPGQNTTKIFRIQNKFLVTIKVIIIRKCNCCQYSLRTY